MQISFYFDQSRCICCHTCNIACRDWHNIQDVKVNWRRITTIEEGVFPNISVASLSLSCCHCEEPACASVCPVGAITKGRENGVVLVDTDTCLGKDHCELCLQACPYDVPQFGAEENAKMQKCNLCLDRTAEGKNPACVDACPVRALDAGPMEDLKVKYGDTKDGIGFGYDSALRPSILIKPRKAEKEGKNEDFI